MQTHPRLSLIDHLKQLPDPRVTARCEHELIDVLVIALCTLLCGGQGFNDMEDFGHAKHEWFKTFLRLPKEIPGHDTFNRVFAALKPQAFLECFLSWTQNLSGRAGGPATKARAAARLHPRGASVGFPSDGGKRPRAAGDAALLAEWRGGLVC